MNGLVLLTSVLGVFWIAFMIGTRYRRLRIPVLLGAGLRVAVGLVGFYAVDLPYSTSDARSFELQAWTMATQGWSAVWEGLNPVTGFSYVAPFAVIYGTVGRHPLALVMYNAMLAVFTIALVYRIAERFGGTRSASVAAYLIALSPAAILMSAVVLREATVAFGVALGVFGLLEATRTRRVTYLALGVAGFGWAALHHGGVLFAGLATLLLFALANLRRSVSGARVSGPTALAAVLALLILGLTASTLAPGTTRLPSIGFVNLQTLEGEILTNDPREALGGSSYYGGTTTETWGQALRQLPGRVGLFLLSPLPWTVTSLTQVAGLVDALLWAAMLLVLVRYRAVLWRTPEARVVVVFLAFAIVTYALGTTNAGTALRHRTKFSPVLMAVVAYALVAGRRESRRPQSAARPRDRMVRF